MIYLACSEGHTLNSLADQREMAWYLLKLGLHRSCGITIGEDSIERNKWGKPLLKESGGNHFNISHCKGGVALSISRSRTGIDMEKVRTFCRTTADKVLSQEEQGALTASDSPDRDFFRFWTLKESYFKALGTGLACPMNRVSFTIGQDLRVGCNRKHGFFRLIENDLGFVTAVCNLNDNEQVNEQENEDLEEMIICLRVP